MRVFYNITVMLVQSVLCVNRTLTLYVKIDRNNITPLIKYTYSTGGMAGISFEIIGVVRLYLLKTLQSDSSIWCER